MQVHHLTQGSPEWHAYRRNHFNASDAPAMLGCSPYKTRDQLIAELATGIVPEVDAATQRIFDAGHRFEALARPLAEKIIDEELAPLVGSNGKYSASFDGVTLMGDTGWEHKSLNADLRAAMVEGCTGADLPKVYRVQMEQQCMVEENLTRVLFTASKWSDDGLVEARHCWYTPDPALRAEIVAGWAQLEKDVAAWVPPEDSLAPAAKKVVASLPVVFDMRVEGKLVACNLEHYKPAALAYIEAINTELATDQDFADADADARFCRDSADKLELAVEQAMGHMGDINTAINTVREIAAAFDAKGLALEKLVKAQKDNIKLAEVQRGQKELAVHIAALNAAMPASYMPTVPADFGAAVKNKRTVDSLRSAINDELARSKIAASEIANRIHANVKALQDSGLVVHDAAALVLKAPDDLAAIIANRVTAEQQRQEAERERIRKEEAERADREAREKLAAEERAAQAAITQAAKAETLHPAVAADLGTLVREQHAEAVAGLDAQQVIGTAQRAAAAATYCCEKGEQQGLVGKGCDDCAEASAGYQAAMFAPKERTGPPTLRIGTIKERLGHMTVTAEDLRALGFEAAGRERAAPLYHEDDFPEICEAIAAQALAAKAEFLKSRAAVAA
ncbi:YqaJ viral recombinase family protein [Acidovorax sp. LjRoot74]|uniref:YqaJ viral recombinase family protein n=1 Tax=Acidovorax sp. LjRoot74 TaxID=3342337 RepID=UPI003ECD7CC5